MRPVAYAVALLATIAVSTSAVAAEGLRTMIVTGVGKVTAVPDMAIVTLGVAEQGKTAGQATEAMSASSRKILDAIKSAGVADRDVQTSGLDLSPVYDHRSNPPGSAPVLTGFRASTSFTVRLRKIDGVGALLDKLVGVGANTVQGISFDVSEREALTDQARKNAVADALRKARLYAEAAGVKLGDILTIGESSAGPVPRPTMRMAAVAAEPMAIAAGETEIESTIQLKIAIHGGQ